MRSQRSVVQGASFSLLILVVWVALGAIFAGIGALFRRACGSRVTDVDGWLPSFWIGWVCTLFVLQLWHLLLPVDARALLVMTATGAFGLAAAGRASWTALARAARQHWFALVVLVLVAAWLSNLALGGPRNGDSGMYHIPTVRWFAEYPIVLGIGNLYRHYAFNQSYFLYVAMLDVGPFSHQSHHLANGLLALALLARVLVGLTRTLRLGHACAAADLFYALFLPASIELATGINLTSPSPDFPIFVLGVVISGDLIGLLARSGPRPGPDTDVLAITLLAVGGVTVKLSFTGLAGVMVLLTIGVWLWRDRPARHSRRLTLAGVVAVAVLGLGTWIGRGVLLSGYPAFPIPFAPLPVAWRVPLDVAIMQTNSTRVWNQVPGAWRAAWSSPRWFATWLESLGWTDPGVLLPIGIGVAASFLAIGRRVIVRRRGSVSAVVLLPTLASLVFCFLAGPFPRYAAATFWLFAVESSLVALSRDTLGTGRRVRVVIVAVALLLTSRPMFDGRALLRRDLRGLETAPNPQLHQERLASGLVVAVPAHDQCWDAPLPCAPEPSPALRLRHPGDLAAGFMIDPSVPRQSMR